jgi:hypothetical protein
MHWKFYADLCVLCAEFIMIQFLCTILCCLCIFYASIMLCLCISCSSSRILCQCPAALRAAAAHTPFGRRDRLGLRVSLRQPLVRRCFRLPARRRASPTRKLEGSLSGTRVIEDGVRNAFSASAAAPVRRIGGDHDPRHVSYSESPAPGPDPGLDT